jgi:hypothetical protein
MQNAGTAPIKIGAQQGHGIAEGRWECSFLEDRLEGPELLRLRRAQVENPKLQEPRSRRRKLRAAEKVIFVGDMIEDIRSIEEQTRAQVEMQNEKMQNVKNAGPQRLSHIDKENHHSPL